MRANKLFPSAIKKDVHNVNSGIHNLLCNLYILVGSADADPRQEVAVRCTKLPKIFSKNKNCLPRRSRGANIITAEVNYSQNTSFTNSYLNSITDLRRITPLNEINNTKTPWNEKHIQGVYFSFN